MVCSEIQPRLSMETSFLGCETTVSIIHINAKIFRILIKVKGQSLFSTVFDQNLDTIRLDVIMTDLTQKKFVKFHPKKENDSSQKIDQFISTNSYKEKKDIKDYLRQNREFGTTGLSFKPARLKAFELHFERIVKDFEQFLTEMELNYEDSASNDQLFMVKFIDVKQKKYCFYHVYENEVCDSFRVVARNNFKSYCKSIPSLPQRASKRVKRCMKWANSSRRRARSS